MSRAARKATAEVATKDNKARVSFAPGKTDAYIIVQGDHEVPHPGENGRVYEGRDGLEEATLRVEWLNWNGQSKQDGEYHHPRDEQAAKREQARAQLIEAHRALQEVERYGPALAKQIASLRAERAREEQDAEECEVKAGQDSRTVKVRREYRKSAQQARLRAEGLGQKIAQLEATPPLPSRLAGRVTKEEERGVRGGQEAAGSAGPHDAEPGGTAEASS